MRGAISTQTRAKKNGHHTASNIDWASKEKPWQRLRKAVGIKDRGRFPRHRRQFGSNPCPLEQTDGLRGPQADFGTTSSESALERNFRIVARLDRRCLGAEAGVRSRRTRSETSSISRLGGSRWRLGRARGMRLAMEFEWSFFRFLFGAKR